MSATIIQFRPRPRPPKEETENEYFARKETQRNVFIDRYIETTKKKTQETRTELDIRLQKLDLQRNKAKAYRRWLLRSDLSQRHPRDGTVKATLHWTAIAIVLGGLACVIFGMVIGITVAPI